MGDMSDSIEWFVQDFGDISAIDKRTDAEREIDEMYEEMMRTTNAVHMPEGYYK